MALEMDPSRGCQAPSAAKIVIGKIGGGIQGGQAVQTENIA